MAVTNPHPALQHLQFTFTPAQYLDLLERSRKYSGRGHIRPGTMPEEEYGQVLPIYVVARCPLCDAAYTAALDTHSLHTWTTHPDLWKSVSRRQVIRCHHFVAVHKFVNLRDHLPTEMDYYSSKLDVPFVMPVFLPDDVQSAAVIHSLPICRIEDGAFVPRYAAYMITYYSENPKELWRRRRQEEEDRGQNDPDYEAPMLYPSFYVTNKPELYDLVHWVESGKLYWLDPSTPALTLRQYGAEDFPYTNLEGYRQAFTYRNGKITLTL